VPLAASRGPRKYAPNPFAFDSIRSLVPDANYDWHNFGTSTATCRSATRPRFVEPLTPILRAFNGRCAQLLLYAGWRDTCTRAENTVLYYERAAGVCPEQSDWMRMCLVLGIGPLPRRSLVDTFYC